MDPNTGIALHRLSMLLPLVLVLILVLALRDIDGRTLKQLTSAQQRAAADSAAMNVAGFQNAGCANASALSTWHPYRPGFHITVPYGWLNDPHGYLFRNGVHHLFFQYNPKTTAWGAPFWGHVVSSDLARWRWLPPALLPDSAYDFNGIWSGAATIGDDGTPWLSYTSAGTLVPELGNFFQSQSVASPVNKSDPWLRAWRKSPANPVVVQTPPGGTNFQFRDTTPANRDVRSAIAAALKLDAADKGSGQAAPNATPPLAWAVGTQAFCLGTAAIYTAPAIEGPWTFSGNLFNQMAMDGSVRGSPGMLNGQCEAPGNGSRAAFGGPCNQFGSKCRMWEVTDFAEVAPGVYVVKWSDQDRSRTPFSAEWYVLSDELNPAALRLGPQFNDVTAVAASALDTLVTGRLGGRAFAPLRLDYGGTYASKFEHLQDGRIVMNTWVLESFLGCVDSCSDHTPAGDAYLAHAPFKGALQLPRRVTYIAKTRSLAMLPVDELAALRRDKARRVVDLRGTALPAGGTPLVLLDVKASAIQGPRSRQLEARLAFNITPSTGGTAPVNFTIGLRLLLGGGAHADVLLSGATEPQQAAAPSGGGAGARVTALRVEIDRRSAGGFTPPTAEGGPVPLPGSGDGGGTSGGPRGWALPYVPLALDVWVDHSVLEAYAMGGLGRVTTRLYPADEAAPWGLAAFGAATGGSTAILASAQVWILDNAFAGQPPLC